MSDPTAAFQPGEDETAPEVPDFDLIRRIGQGGFGQVWLAVNRTTGRMRAVKLISLRRRGTMDPAGREITSITRLEANVRRQHPNLLNIHHVGQTAEHLFYVMDLADDVSGAAASSQPGYQPATLQRRLENGPLSPEECFNYAGQLLAGLAFLHQAGMIHRDVKPANCLFVDGQLKLADFGLLTEANPQISRVGTQKYMPPDGRMDARADVFAAGLVIYEMITGLPADSFPRLGEKANQVARSPVLCTLIRLALGACQPDPQQRFPNARAMLAELTSSGPEAAACRVRSRRRIGVSAACAAIVLVAAGVWFWASRPPRVHVNFITHPFEASIYLDGTLLLEADNTPYTTPCTVENLPARVHHVVFKHEDQTADRDLGQVDFARIRQVVGRWSSQP